MITFISLLLVALYTPLWLFVAFVMLYAIFIPDAYEVVVIAAIVDAAYAGVNVQNWYVYTVVASACLILGTVLRPYFTFHI